MSSLSSLNNTLLGGLSSGGLVTPTVSSTGTPTLSGLASGLDDNAIIQDLLATDQGTITDLQNQESGIASQQAAFQQIQTQLTSLQTDISSLNQLPQQSLFNVRTVTPSDPNLVSAAATSSAIPGDYSLTINSLATANEIASQGFSSATAQITQGTFQIGTASGSTATITIDSTNNNLQGLAAAINNADVGVTATIVNDGSGSGNQPYRLLLTANQTGTANAVTITNNLAADNNGAVQPVFDSTYVGQVNTGANYTGTAVPTANSGAGTYTGTANDTYTFTVVQGGTVGTTNGIQLAYTDSNGGTPGTITLNSSDAGVLQNVAQGLQIQLSAGTLVTGQSFSVKTYVPTVQQAANASVTVGSGSGALSVQNSSNQIDGLIQGVTVNLLGADPTTPVTLTVSSDTSQASTAIQAVVTDYNNLMSYIDQTNSYDPSSQQAGILLGNVQVTDIQNQIRNILGNVVSGVNPNMNNLSDLGITFGENDQLILDQTQLNNVLSGNVSGVSLADVQSLFATTGSTSNPGISFVIASPDTQTSGTAPYQVNITQAAQQASMVAATGLANSITIDSSNNTFNLTVNGTNSGAVTLQPGTYTQAGLAQEVQTAINAQPSLAGSSVTAGLTGNQLTLTTDNYGSAAEIAIGSGNALSALGFAGTETGTGTDVAGSFEVNGVTENATGLGQVLTGDAGNANTAGLSVAVNLTPAQVGTGVQANVTVTQGLASSLNAVLNNMLDPSTGQLTTINNNFETEETSLNQEISTDQTNMQNKQKTLLAQFTAMEQAVSQLQSIGDFLSQTFDTSSQQSQKL